MSQEKELKMFREGLKQDMKMLKHEVEMLPRDTRKEALRQRKEEKEIEHVEKVGQGRTTLNFVERSDMLIFFQKNPVFLVSLPSSFFLVFFNIPAYSYICVQELYVDL